MTESESRQQDSWVVGSAPGCDLRVQDPVVSGVHCRVSRRSGNFVVEDLRSTNGTFVSGSKLSPGVPVQVQYGAQVMLAGRVQMPWPTTRAKSSADPIDVSSRSGTRVVPPPPGTKRTEITIGRSPDSTIRIDLPIISWNHAVIREESGKWVLEDKNSTNGTSIGQVSNRIQRAALETSDVVFFGSYKMAASQLLTSEGTVEIGESPFTKVPFKGASMEIGRDPDCDIPLPYPMVSWRHARLTRTPEGTWVEDLGSRNGTYLNGVRITGRTLAKTGDEIGLGSFRFHLLEDGQLARREYYGNVTIEATEIVVNAPGGKQLLAPVSLTVFPSELVALMGPAGAGKTTLLKALNGYTPPAHGSVLFNGADLYRFYDRFRQQMGYVPQDDIVHPQLTVRQALYFSAKLRTDLSDAEIDRRTQQVLEDLGIHDKIDTVIGSPERKTLSGGQRKRVNIGLELITDTPVLFLDEPTSGLSSYDAESVVDLLKELSKAGKTIITTIHQPSLKVYRQFDDLIMVSRDRGEKPGALVYFGPAYPDAIQFFNPPKGPKAPQAQPDLNPEMLFSGMAAVPEGSRTDTWRQRYEVSRYQKEFVASRSGKRPQGGESKTGEEAPRRQFGLTQWLALVKRNVFVKLRDRAQTAVLLVQAPLFALLVCLVIYPLKAALPGAASFGDLAEKLPVVHFLMVVAAIWFGCNNAARDIVGEWTIYKRERMVTLKLVPYLFSKLTVLLGLCVFQCATLLGLVDLICGLHGGFFSGFLVLLLSSMIGAGLGLCISALAKTTESAIALLPVVLLPIIAVGGGMRPVYQMPKVGQMFSLVIPSRWAYEANLVRDAQSPAWGEIKATPDFSCTLEGSPSIEPSLAAQSGSPAAGAGSAAVPQLPPGVTPEMAASMAKSGQLPPGVTPAMAAAMAKGGKLPPGVTPGSAQTLTPHVAPAGAEVTSLTIMGDAAEVAIPNYVITAKGPSGKEETCRASAKQAYPVSNPTSHAVRFRHTFGTSIMVLCSMFFVLTSGAIGILRKRDSEPQ
ncbi:MAG TPA: FHA domain-containing protein [Terracidiphilus sp.]|nr:FHA domain-containing protein [Terracidiphilus sp.]